MIKNYLKVAFRNLMRHKRFSAINLVGLAMGMAACLLILQYVSFELSFDQFHKNGKNIYRVANDRYQNGKLIQHGMITYSAVGKAMKDDYEEVAEHTRVEPLGGQVFILEDKKFEEDGMAVDNSFLTMFSFPLLAGDKLTALKEPNALVISETLARKIFNYTGNDWENIIGKTITLSRDSLPYKITAICKDVPENSHLQFDFLMSYVSLYSGGNSNWKNSDYDFTESNFWHYIQLKPGADYKAFNAKMKDFSQWHFQGNKISGSDETFYLQPLSKAHLYSDFEYEIGITGRSSVVWSLLIVAVFIIIIAWINYINLTTARAMERAKEVGIRKVVGGNRKQLIMQFLSESFLINVFAFALAIALVYLAQPAFNHLLQHKLSFSYLLTKGFSGYSVTIGLIVLLIAGILVSGFYSAFVLSSFKPISILKGRHSSSKKGIFLRKSLVVGQFAVTVALITGSLIVVRQMKFMNKKDLGFNMDQMLIVRGPGLTKWDSTFIGKMNSFKDEIKQLAYVKGAATSQRVPGNEFSRAFDVHRKDDSTGNHVTLRNVGVSYDFLDLYKIKLQAGRNFTPTDYNPHWDQLHNVLLNEMAVKLLGFSSNSAALGKSIMVFGKQWDIIGVAANFHQKSLRYPIEPAVIMPLYGSSNPISVKVNPADLPATIAAIKQKYALFFPGNMFDYYFLDERFNEQYKSELLFEKAFGIFSGFAIFIACLGLFGLSLYSIMLRTKEIGVRKVLGATVPNIMVLVSKDFIRSVLIADIIAFPVAWFVMTKWLQNFAYRIHIGWWVFMAAALIALLVALITISFQAIRAAIANPVKSLRTE